MKIIPKSIAEEVYGLYGGFYNYPLSYARGVVPIPEESPNWPDEGSNSWKGFTRFFRKKPIASLVARSVSAVVRTTVAVGQAVGAAGAAVVGKTGTAEKLIKGASGNLLTAAGAIIPIVGHELLEDGVYDSVLFDPNTTF